MCWRRAGGGGDGWSADLSSFRGAEGVVGAYAGGGYVSNGGMAGTPSAPGARWAGSGLPLPFGAETPLPLPLPALGAGGWWPRRAVG